MYLPLAQAAGWEFLIYLVVGVIWLVGNILQQNKAKAKAEEMRRRREEREREERRTGKKPAKPHPLEDELEAFLGRLAGEHRPSTPQVPKPPPVPKPAPTTRIQFDQPPPPPPPLPKSPPPARTKGASLEMMEMDTSFKEMEELEDAIEISYEDIGEEVRQQTLQNVKQLQVDLSSMMVRLPRLPVQRMRSVHTQSTPPDLKDRKVFKKAIIASAILAPPAALKDPSSDAL